ncbi:MAG: hypothetical protein KatS3mg076_3263 [Candidatus Binatia bacterium]|nr:MAG: hypothetical protein KatS3mg076_3263 [Candidatus Binatia bacterium]
MRRVLLCAGLVAFLAGCRGEHQGPGTIEGKRLPDAVVKARDERQAQAVARLLPSAERRPSKQILFGDLHVHTTFSTDAFLRSLPLLQGEGVHPPADACDFARYCADLDFWSITDHAEAITPLHWKETKESIRECNALAGDPSNPDVVAFLGWEWTQVGGSPQDHYGHKNVIFRDLEEDRVPKRPISALNERLLGAMRRRPPFWQRIQLPLLDFPNRQAYFDFDRYLDELDAVRLCPEGVDTRELPEDCHEKADTPKELFEKLAQWGFPVLVIPHGTTWGLYTPPGSTLDKQLAPGQHDEKKQRLIEVFSGHGNSEEFRPWREVEFDASGNPVCPEPTKDYLPCCWQAGELIRERCGDLPPEECERRVREARANYLAAGAAGHMVVPGATIEDWKDCGHCRDCYLPAFKYRPRSSVQYALAIGNFDDGTPRHFRFGFVASSDNHSARPGTGYKEYARRMMTEATGARSEAWRRRVIGQPAERVPRSVPFDPRRTDVPAFVMLEFERQASFFLTGGLVAVHAEGRSREAIWDALGRREVYGTSGERILLWFHLLNGPEGELPMGSEVELAAPPVFRVRAVGAFEQNPGCPEHVVHALSPERIERLCRGECYNPSDRRRKITRIEVVKIQPQRSPEEDVAALVRDPWRIFDCPGDPAGCEVVFDDPEFPREGRQAVYYVRAIQEPTLAVNAANVRCRYDDQGRCVEVNPCYGDYRTPFDDDCLAPNEERAWSSPIYVRPGVSPG